MIPTLAIMLKAWDWGVLGGYLLVLLAAGWFLARREARDTKSYFLAGRSMPAWAVAVSILATAQSAATYLGAPEKGWSGDLRYLLANLGVIVAAVVVSALFLPLYYRLNVGTPYELLESTCGAPARRLASVWYLAGRFMASGVRVYIGALPFCLVVFGEVTPLGLLACIGGFIAFGALFTLAGGVRAAIWSDVIQVGVYLGSAVVIAMLIYHQLPVDGATLWHKVVGEGSGVTVVGPVSELTDVTKPFTLLTGVTGWALLNIAFFAMDQDLTQRLLACRDSRQAVKSLLLNTVVITLPVVVLFCVMGVLLGVFYNRADVMGQLPPAPALGGDLSTKALVDFSGNYAPAGILGLMLAGVLAAGPAGINSSLNSMASSFIGDIYRPLTPGRSERHYLVAGRWATVGIGMVMGGFAAACIWLQGEQNLIDFALGVMPIAYAGLLGVFFGVVLFKRLPTWAALAALPVGTATVLALMQWSVLCTPWQLVAGAGAALVVCGVGRVGGRKT